MANPYAAQYASIDLHARIEDASPHRLIQMLMEGAQQRLAQAHGAIERGDPVVKGEQIGRAIAIIGGLQGSLDIERGGELAANLDELYSYMQRRLLEANRDSSIAAIEEVANLLREVKTAWDAIPVDYHHIQPPTP
ncbi:MAG: flagellar export chaperone FliS [Halothiobacillaceae bacterium]|nr:flagellar export chaperone FliS [Halothiobacillaceae bacterium]